MIGIENLPQAIRLIINGRSGFLLNSLRMGWLTKLDMLVNFCPALGTVLANEEVEEGRAKEGGYPIERRPLRQWVLKITSYADRLIEDLDIVDWPESLKKLQINWIGKSEGAQVQFLETTTGESITVFTTRPDTLFGATYMVLAPENPLVDRIAAPDNRLLQLKLIKKQASSKSDLERTELIMNKTGVFTGAYAINPVNEEKIPIWISDYVIMGYGTGAIMAVPAHDERDFEFAKTFQLPIRPVYDLIDQARRDTAKKWQKGSRCWPGGGGCC